MEDVLTVIVSFLPAQEQRYILRSLNRRHRSENKALATTIITEKPISQDEIMQYIENCNSIFVLNQFFDVGKVETSGTSFSVIDCHEMKLKHIIRVCRCRTHCNILQFAPDKQVNLGKLFYVTKNCKRLSMGVDCKAHERIINKRLKELELPTVKQKRDVIRTTEGVMSALADCIALELVNVTEFWKPGRGTEFLKEEGLEQLASEFEELLSSVILI